MKQLTLALQFLTIIPIKVKGDVSARDLSRSAVFFPVVGAFQGLFAACVASLAVKAFSAEIASGLTIAVLAISNGGFHLDGLADTFDALAVKSSGHAAKDRQKRLSVMKDSATGAIGVVSLVLVILLKFLFVKDLLLRTSAPLSFSMLFLMPLYSRWAMVPALYHGRPAREDGLGKIFADSVGVSTVVFSLLPVALFHFPVFSTLGTAHGERAFALFFLLSVSLYLFSRVTVCFCKRRFGGLTGDNLGAISEISEILFLMVASLWLRLFI
jgi:adenosylcobinamide-GDP ribazoletransferase